MPRYIVDLKSNKGRAGTARISVKVGPAADGSTPDLCDIVETAIKTNFGRRYGLSGSPAIYLDTPAEVLRSDRYDGPLQQYTAVVHLVGA